jgi:hypothetical protein
MQAIGCLFVAVYGIAQLIAAYAGLDYYVGGIWAVVIISTCLFLRFTLPLTIASFFGALYVWEWHWYFALVFAAPGLLLIIPSILNAAVERGRATVGR